MDKPVLYANTNHQQRRFTKEIIDELHQHFDWKNNNGDTLLDIGTGPGDVMMDFVLPLLAENYRKIVGSDLNEEMVKYGIKTYGHRDPRIEFQLLDISDENLQISDRYDHITSFWVLHNVKTQSSGLKNVFNLLNPGGDILLEVAAKGPFYSTFKNLSVTPKWQKHLRNIHRFSYFQQQCKDPVEDFVKRLKEVGFQDIYCRTKDLQFIYSGFQEFKDSFQSINILEGDIPAELHDEFYSEYFDDIIKQDMVSIENVEKQIIKITVTVLIAYAKRK